MGVSGKHQDNSGNRTAENNRSVPRRGGPQTGTGFTGGRKPKAKDIKTDGGGGILPAWLTGKKKK